jgi:hypothetical protein
MIYLFANSIEISKNMQETASLFFGKNFLYRRHVNEWATRFSYN